jgi:predicted enzyme related to lactoylglutathione lyase
VSERSGYAAGIPCWVDLTTTDPEAAMGFYAELLDWELERGSAELGGYTMCRLAGRRVAGINGQPGPDGMPPVWITYLAADDLDAAAARITEAGGNVMMGPHDVADQGRMALAADPTGALFGLWQARAHTGAELVNEPGCLSWSELVTTDLDAAGAFFRAVFGWTCDDVDTGGPPYRTFAVDDTVVGGMLDSTGYPEGIGPHWMSYFAVEDVDVALRRATELGATVHAEPVDSPFGRWGIITDPQGAGLTLITLPGDPAA